MASPKPRLWVLGWGLFPRRVTIYLEEKGISDKFDIVEVGVTPNGLGEPEGKPPGTVPILEIQRPENNKPGKYIFQSTAILEYLEDAYGSEGPDMRGTTPEARARVRECMDAMNEATTSLVLYVQHGSAMYSMRMEQKIDAAKAGKEKMHKALGLLEMLAEPDVRFLVRDSPTIVDCVLTSTFQFAKTVYGLDLVKEHPRLKGVVEAFDGRGTAIMPEVPAAMVDMKPKMLVT